MIHQIPNLKCFTLNISETGGES